MYLNLKKIVKWCTNKGHLANKPLTWLKARLLDAKWLYKLLVARTFFRDRSFLTNIVGSELKPYKKELLTKIHYGEVLSRKRYFVAAFCLPFILAGILLLTKSLFNAQNLFVLNSDNVNILITTLNSTAAVVASFTGILVALIAFGINVNTLYVGAEDHLFQVIIRRGGYMFIAALSVGSVVFSLAGGMFSIILTTASLLVITLEALFLGAFVLVLEIWLLSYTLHSIGKKACRELLSNNFKDEHRKSLLAEIARRIGVNIFKQRLDEMGFEWNIMHNNPKEGQRQYNLKKIDGYLIDVYFPTLKVLSEKWKLKTIEDSDEACFTRTFDSTENIIPIVSVLPYSNQNTVAIIGRAEGDIKPFQKLINRSFICSKKPKLLIPESNWDALARMIKAQIRDSNDSGLEDLLNVVEEIVTDYLSSLNKMGVAHARHDIFSSAYTNYKSPELSNLDFSALIVIASESADTNCINSLFKFLNMVGRTAFEEKSLEYYTDILSWIGALYHQCSPKQGLADVAQHELIDSFNFLGPLTFQSYLWKNDKSLETYEKITSYIEQYLNRFSIVALNVARNEDTKTFKKMFDILDSLFINEHSSPRSDYEIAKQSFYHYPDNLDYQNKLAVSEARLNIHCLVNLTRMVISAWLAELRKVNKLDYELAYNLIETAMEPIKETTDIFEIYLHASGATYQSAIGYDWWDHVDRLAGKSYSTWGSVFDRWIEPFWIVYSLKLAGSMLHLRNLSNIRLVVGFREYNYQKLEERLKGIIANEEFYNWFAKKEDLEKGKDIIMGIFSEIKERQKQADIDKLISSPLSTKKISSFEKDCIKGYLAERPIYNLCAEFAIHNIREVEHWSSPVLTKSVFEKERFIEDWHVGFGGQEVYGKELCNKEDWQFSKFIEDNLLIYGEIDSFESIASKLKSAAAKMRSSGRSPVVILIPEDHRLQSVFTDKPSWQRESKYKKNNLPIWVTTFDSMEVFIWSNPTQTSIAIIDIAEFIELNTHGDKDIPVAFKLEKVSVEDVKSWLQKDNNEYWKKELGKCDGKIEILAQKHLLGELTSKAKLGIVNKDAGGKFILDERKIGVLCDKSKKICHTIDCKATNTIHEDQREYYPTASYARAVLNYELCDECDPLWGKML